MKLSYHLPKDSPPDEAIATFYETRDDGSFQLAVDGLPSIDKAPADPPDTDNSKPDNSKPDAPKPKDSQPDAFQPAACHGAGATADGRGGNTQSVIAAHDSDAICQSLEALASGTVRLKV